MKKLILSIAILFLSACIPVEDFGDYWNKGFIDATMQGKWESISAEDQKKHQLQVTEKDGSVLFESLDAEDRDNKEYESITARSLKAGPYTFFMAVEKRKPSVNPGNGKADEAPPIKGLVRYEIKDGVFHQYSLIDDRMSVFLKEKYPDAKNFQIKKFLSSDSVDIKVLDDEVYKILSEIPDAKEFWKLQGEWRKIK